jgi:hypothetical protein
VSLSPLSYATAGRGSRPGWTRSGGDERPVRRWSVLGVLLLGLAATHLSAALLPSGIITIHSQGTGQFIAHGARPQISGEPLSPRQDGPTILRLDPPLLVLTCERIKQALLRELACPDQWRGQIEMNIQFTPYRDPPIVIRSAVYADGWRGYIDIPDEIEASKLVRIVVQALLLEMANRHPGEGLTDIPLWLTEGLARLVQDSAGPGLVPQPHTLLVRAELKADPVEMACARLQNFSPLTFDELSLPGPAQLKGAELELYQNTAEIFVHELLRLRDGQLRLGTMLALLPGCFNWQTAFYQVYGPELRNPLEVEKWWALTLLDLRNQQKWRGRPPALTSDAFAVILTVSAQVRNSSNNLPVPSKLSLQTLVERWPYAVQKPILLAKINQLAVLRVHAAAPLVPLVDKYRTTLLTYLRQQDQGGANEPLNRGVIPVRSQLLARNLIHQLDALDRQRETWRRKLQ